MKQKKFKKLNSKEKLFTVYPVEGDKFIFSVGSEVKKFAWEKLGYNLQDRLKLESFMRKCYRSYVLENQ